MNTPEVKPALNAAEWKALQAPYAGDAIGDTLRREVNGWTYGVDDVRTMQVVIALANARLPDSHPAKITREKIGAILRVVDDAVQYRNYDDDATTDAAAFAEALRSYLPPPQP